MLTLLIYAWHPPAPLIPLLDNTTLGNATENFLKDTTKLMLH